MRVQDKSLDPRIIKAAKKEFNKKGFKNSKLRDIAKNAGVTTGAIYIRYKNKDELFYALCKDAIDSIENYYNLTEEQKMMMPNIFTDLDLLKMTISYHSKIILDNADGLELLFFKSEGSKYQEYKKELLNTHLSKLNEWFCILENNKIFYKNKTDKMIFRTIAAFYITFIEEIIKNKNELELINEYINKISIILFEIFQKLITKNKKGN